MSSPQSSGRPAYCCKQCNLVFSSQDSLTKHKEIMRNAGKRHFHCKTCGIDFKTEMAEVRHIQLEHAKKQNLTCPGCGEGPFSRLGGLMSHIEKDCIRIDAAVLEEMRQEKMKFATVLEAVSKKRVRGNFASFMPSEKQKIYPMVDAPENHEFPTDTKVEVPSAQDPWADWDNPKPLNEWKEDDGVVLPAPDQVEADRTAKPAKPIVDPDDPDTPGFDISRYYNRFSEKYDCPRPRCEKCFKTRGGLIGHLRNAHKGKFYECPVCHKRFPTLTAMSQHAESNGNFCKMRHGLNYGAYIDQLTAGIVSVGFNDNDDGTKKFMVNPEVAQKLGREKPKEAPRFAAADNAENPDSWW